MDRRLELGRIEVLIVVERKALSRPQQCVGERRGDLNRGTVRERYRHDGRSPGSRERPLFSGRGKSRRLSFGRVNHAACAFLGPAAMRSGQAVGPEPDAHRPDRIPSIRQLNPARTDRPGVFRPFSSKRRWLMSGIWWATERRPPRARAAGGCALRAPTPATPDPRPRPRVAGVGAGKAPARRIPLPPPSLDRHEPNLLLSVTGPAPAGTSLCGMGQLDHASRPGGHVDGFGTRTAVGSPAASQRGGQPVGGGPE